MWIIRIILPLFILIAVACEEGSNCDSSESAVILNFKKQKTKIVNIDSSIIGFAAKGFSPEKKDSFLIFDSISKWGAATLPLSKNTDTTAYLISFFKNPLYKDSVFTDSIFFIYHRKIELTSSDCGFVVRSVLTNVFVSSAKTIKSVKLIGTSTKNNNVNNVEVIL